MGRYNEARLLYTSPLFGADANPLEERRTIHLGMDFFVEPGTAVHAPLDGVVHVLANNTAPLDYGPLVILKHDVKDAGDFFTLYGHLTTDTLAQLKIGQTRCTGDRNSRASAPPTKTEAGRRIFIFKLFWICWIWARIFPAWLSLPSARCGPAFRRTRNLLVGIPKERFPSQRILAA